MARTSTRKRESWQCASSDRKHHFELQVAPSPCGRPPAAQLPVLLLAVSAVAGDQTPRPSVAVLPTARSKNNPEVLEQRQRRLEELDARAAAMLAVAPGRPPAWPPERLAALDAHALAHGKRCIMWDDQGAGFFLVS